MSSFVWTTVVLLLIGILVMDNIDRASAACEASVTKFWASSNKAMVTYYKNTGNKTEAATTKTAFLNWKKAIPKTQKCLDTEDSQPSSSFSANIANVDLASAILVQINQNNWWLTTKNKGLDYFYPEVQNVMTNCFTVLNQYSVNASMDPSTVVDPITSIQSTIASNIANTFNTVGAGYSYKPTKFPVMAQKATLLFYKLNFNNKFFFQNTTLYKERAKATVFAIKSVKLAWKSSSVLSQTTSDSVGRSVWFTLLDTTSIAIGIKYRTIYYFAETQDYLISCFSWLANLTATAASTESDAYKLIYNLGWDVVWRCYNLGLLVTTEPPSSSPGSTLEGCCVCSLTSTPALNMSTSTQCLTVPARNVIASTASSIQSNVYSTLGSSTLPMSTTPLSFSSTGQSTLVGYTSSKPVTTIIYGGTTKNANGTTAATVACYEVTKASSGVCANSCPQSIC